MDGSNGPSGESSFTIRANFAIPPGSNYGNAGMAYQSTGTASLICPDLLRLVQLGEADGLRGKLVRAFFWCLGPR